MAGSQLRVQEIEQVPSFAVLSLEMLLGWEAARSLSELTELPWACKRRVPARQFGCYTSVVIFCFPDCFSECWHWEGVYDLRSGDSLLLEGCLREREFFRNQHFFLLKKKYRRSILFFCL